MGPRIPLADQVGGVDGGAVEAIDPAGWPSDLDRLDPVDRAQAEEEARVAGRLVAAAADAPGDLLPAAGRHGDLCPDGVAVGSGPLQAEGEPVATGGPVMEVDQGPVEAGH